MLTCYCIIYPRQLLFKNEINYGNGRLHITKKLGYIIVRSKA